MHDRAKTSRVCLPAWLLLPLVWGSAHAGGGPLGIDYEWTLDQHGIWARSYQSALEYAVIGTEGFGALWLGNDDPLGHTFWQSIDSTAISSIAAEGLKYAFTRARPSQGDDPNKWFQGHARESFPSGEVTVHASFVTPFIMDYVREDPWIVALEVLPLYDGIARLKSQAHWPSDVLAGWLLGSCVGWWTSTLRVPISVQILPRGMTIGLSKRF